MKKCSECELFKDEKERKVCIGSPTEMETECLLRWILWGYMRGYENQRKLVEKTEKFMDAEIRDKNEGEEWKQ